MMFDLDLLPTFAVFADTLSFTETAVHCHLTQPAVHGQIKRLSGQLERTLYVRDGRRLVLTPDGDRLAATARDVLAARARFFETPTTLRIAAGRGSWTHLLLPRLGPWLRERRFTALLASGDEAERRVREGRADLGISTEAPDLPSLPLGSVRAKLLVPLQGRPERWIVPSAGRPHRVVLDAWFRSQGHAPELLVSDDWSLTAAMVAEGLGVAVVNDFVAHPRTREEPFPDVPSVTYHLFWRRPELGSTAADLQQAYQTAS